MFKEWRSWKSLPNSPQPRAPTLLFPSPAPPHKMRGLKSSRWPHLPFGCISDLLQTAASWASRRLRDVSCKWNNPGPGTGEAGWGLLGGEVWNSRIERRQRNMVQALQGRHHSSAPDSLSWAKGSSRGRAERFSEAEGPEQMPFLLNQRAILCVYICVCACKPSSGVYVPFKILKNIFIFLNIWK